MKKYNIDNLKHGFRYIKYYARIQSFLLKINKYYLITFVIMSLLSVVFPFLSMIIMKNIMNSLQMLNCSLIYLIHLLLAYISIEIVQILVNSILSFWDNKFSMKGSKELELIILNKAANLCLNDYENPDVYDLLQRAKKVDFLMIYGFFKSTVSLLISLINFLLFSSVLIIWKRWLIPIIVLLSVMKYFSTIYFSKRQFEITKNRAGDERKVWYYQYLLSKDTAFKEVRIFDLSQYFLKKLTNIRNTFIKQDTELLKSKTYVNTIIILLEELIISTFNILLIIDTYKGIILIGDFSTYIRSISRVKGSIESFLGQISSLYKNMLYISQLFDFLDYKSCYVRKIADSLESNEIQINKIDNITINDLCFSYDGNLNFALHDINMSINSGDMIAFVGKNGSGKSTLFKILAGLYTNYTGEIYINGINTKYLNISSYQKKVSVLFQDYIKYESTVKENIAYGNLTKIDATNYLNDILDSMNLGNEFESLDEQLGVWFEDGRQISGGQWLKIALCRTLIKEADMYLFDEPNSALDNISSLKIIKEITRKTTNNICIIISHRITNIKDICNKIFVFNNGYIEAVGTHEELLLKSETYNNLYSSENSK